MRTFHHQLPFTFFFLFAGFVFFPKTISAQSAPSGHFLQECAADEAGRLLFAKFPDRRRKLQEMEAQWYHFFQEKERKDQGGTEKISPYTLPVVFHIIHQNGPENITDDQVLTSLQNLNDAFANLNFYDQGNGVDTKIQFCLAKRDPAGNPTTGINRVVSSLTDVSFGTDIAMKDLIRWEPLQYINIWLVRSINGGGVAGYAYLPFSHGQPEDGIVMLGAIMPNLGGGHSTLVHEMGHYLGLYHTFQGGCTNNDCLADGDRVCDTPPDNTTAPPGDCSAVINSCDTDANSGFATDQNDINWNYVDYGNHACRNGYTQGQADRMGFFIENVRHSLLNSTACQEPCLSPIAASFNADATTVNIGSTVNFTNTSTGGTGYVWSVNGSQFATTANASYTFNALGTFEITLLATNADPNCSSGSSLTVEVVCPVNASFTTSNLYPEPGETVSFTNTTTGASNYTWTLNGTNVSTATNFSTDFNSPGQHNICLTAGNGLCSEQFCQLVFVIEQPESGDCESSFVRRIGDFGVNEESFYLIPDGNGNYFIGGRDGANSIILQVDPSGNIVAQRAYNFTSGDDFIANLMVDSDGYLVGSARDQVNSNTVNVLFKIDWQTGNFIWARQVTNPAYNRFDRVFQHPTNGNYMFYGMTTNAIDNYIIEADKATGAVTWQFVSDYGANGDVYSGHFITSDAIFYAGQGRLGSGLDDIRPTLTKFDLNGNMQWARIHLRSPNQSSRLYNMDLFIENDTIVNCGRGSLSGSNLVASQLLFYKTNINGGLIWAKSYTVTGGTGVAGYRAHPIPGGYIVQGTFDEGGTTARLFVARLNKSGNVVWAKKVNTATAAAGITRPLTLVDGGFVVFAAQTNQYDAGQNNDLLFGKISLDGQVVGAGCDLIEDINLIENAISNPYDGSQVPTVFTVNYPYPASSHSPLPVDLPINDIPGCECTETSSDCNQTFVTAYGSPAAEEGRRIVAVPEGWVFTAAKADSLIIGLLDGSGHLLWQRSMNISNGLTERARDMILTADGFIVACGTTADGPLAVWDNFVLKYDYQNNALVWAKRFDYGNGDRSAFVNITEHPTSGNYIVSGDSAPNFPPNGLGCDALWMELDAANGNTISVKNFDLGSCETFFQPILSSDGTAWYATGRYNSAGGGTDKFRQPITKLDLNGNELWTHLYIRNTTTQNARMYGVTVIEDNSGLFVFGQGDLSGSSTTNVTLQIFKTDLQGNLLWAKNYDILGASSENVVEAIAVPDGFLIMGNYIQGDQDIFLIKTDKNGVLQWVNSYGGAGTEVASDMAYRNGQIFIIGKTNSFGGGNDDMLLMKLDLNGEIQDMDCDFSSSPSSVENTLQNPYDGIHPLTAYAPAYPSSTPMVVQQTPPLAGSQLCFTPCPDTCANGLPLHTTPDALIQNASAQCAGDSMSVILQVCNADSVALPAGTPVSFYAGNPTTAAAAMLGTVLLPAAVAPGECEDFTINIPLPINQEVFVVVNDSGITPTPFDLETDFPNTITQECDFSNNLASFTVDHVPPVLDLGPDLSTCHFEVSVLDAGSGFASYHWFDGSMEQTYSAWQQGTYSVTVTDDCGVTQTDEIHISVIPATIVEIGVDTAFVCEGGSASFTVNGFAGYQWFPAGLVDCDTCATVTATSSVDTCLILLAASGDGCFSADTVCLKIFPSFSTTDTLQFCQGDTVVVFGDPVTSPGDYQALFTSQHGCDSTHTVTLISVGDTVVVNEVAAICQGGVYLFFGVPLTAPGTYENFDDSGTCVVYNSLELSVLDTFFTLENLTVCMGDTADVFGAPTVAAGIYSMVFAAQNGCDSTHTIHLTVLGTAATGETIVICENEMADIFGTLTNVPGNYAQTFQAANGCDSTHTITLLVNDTFLLSENMVICAGDSALIFGNWETQLGEYLQTFQSTDGCDSTVVVTLMVGGEMEISFSTTPPCPYELNGEISATVTGGVPPYIFEWSNGSTTPGELTGVDAGDFSLTVTDAAGCAVSAEVTLTAVQKPVIIGEVTDATCFGSRDGVLMVTEFEPGLQFSFFGSDFSDQTVYENVFPGNWQLFVRDTFGCIWEEFFTVGQSDPVFLQLPGDVTIELGETFEINPTTLQNDLIYAWVPPTWLSCSDCPSPVAQPETTTLYTLTVTGPDGCTATDSLLITVEFNGAVYVPNVFSPNGDGINDTFYLLGKGIAEVRLLRIFDRWGEKVFEKANFPANEPSLGWDGTFKGKPMNSDVFAWYAVIGFLDGSENIEKGDLTLLR